MKTPSVSMPEVSNQRDPEAAQAINEVRNAERENRKKGGNRGIISRNTRRPV
jgi:hypothetical protein